jgi:hypothetical protein
MPSSIEDWASTSFAVEQALFFESEYEQLLATGKVHRSAYEHAPAWADAMEARAARDGFKVIKDVSHDVSWNHHHAMIWLTPVWMTALLPGDRAERGEGEILIYTGDEEVFDRRHEHWYMRFTREGSGEEVWTSAWNLTRRFPRYRLREESSTEERP